MDLEQIGFKMFSLWLLTLFKYPNYHYLHHDNVYAIKLLIPTVQLVNLILLACSLCALWSCNDDFTSSRCSLIHWPDSIQLRDGMQYQSYASWPPPPRCNDVVGGWLVGWEFGWLARWSVDDLVNWSFGVSIVRRTQKNELTSTELINSSSNIILAAPPYTASVCTSPPTFPLHLI